MGALRAGPAHVGGLTNELLVIVVALAFPLSR